jgi:hypothetical protein
VRKFPSREVLESIEARLRDEKDRRLGVRMGISPGRAAFLKTFGMPGERARRWRRPDRWLRSPREYFLAPLRALE